MTLRASSGSYAALTLLVGLSLSACVVRTRTPVSGPRPMGQDEAVRRGYDFCASHNFSCNLENSFLDGDVWRVNFHAQNSRRNGQLRVEFDAYSRNLLRANEPPPILVVAPPPPPPPIQQGPRRMNADEAVREGENYCRSHGYGCRMLDVDLTGDGRVWRVNFEAEGRGSRGRLHLELDAYNRQLLRADEPRAVVVAPPPPPQPGRRPLNAEDARRKGDDFCRSRGYACRMIDQDYFGGHVWKMNYEVVGGGRGRVHVEFDAFDHRMVNVREDVRR